MEDLKKTAERIAIAIWQAEVAAGTCSTKWPLTASVEKRLLAAGYAAAGILMADLDGPVSKEMQLRVNSLDNLEHAKGLLGNLGFVAA